MVKRLGAWFRVLPHLLLFCLATFLAWLACLTSFCLVPCLSDRHDLRRARSETRRDEG
ncbi:uncharacterized protein K452DRAFT_288439 [Aplosporella prunicola CBS 121167]|uniref:Uncharacterized protein n=1 Tax=Aplosporella prunicola CBS 121167 TaxID=1176127 RepID=A0A6A6BCQ1_9PEZI|nr:uncharacterized protein K452DRAFT_288439 [Aplosporella prunicola CBS 121167]KAF2141065.1 hypothetical protein K452DRAFT_288439 [Aplosporella prunicola CBS 121167]